MKMRIVGGIAVGVMLSAIVPAAAIAAPQVFTYTDKDSYQAGDTIEVSLAGENEGEGMSVDVYIGLLTPDGALWTLGELAWSEGIWPWIRDIYLPSQFNMDQTPLFYFPLPCEAPPIDQPGEFAFVAALMHSATFDFASAISQAPFEVLQITRDYYVNAELGADVNDGSEDGPWRTVTYALNTVAGCKIAPVTMHVAAGAYSSSANGESFPLNMKSFLSLVGDGADVTVLDAEGASSSVICCLQADDSVIEGFTVTGGHGRSGGGICCLGGSPTIRHNTITCNSAEGGGGVYCENGSATVSGNTISDNSAWDGGGIRCDSGWPMISDNVISDNSGYGAHGGGAVHCCHGYPTIQNNTIQGNSGYAQGGGINSESTSWAQISGNTIRSNSTTYRGGGVGCYLGVVSISGNSITDNSAGYGDGGGIFCWSGCYIIENNSI